MIFYFTGTGNSLQIARDIAGKNNERLISIAPLMYGNDSIFEYDLMEGEIIGFVYPVYAYAPPRIVLDFIKRLRLNNYKGNYIFTIVTCGNIIGNTIEKLENHLKKYKLHLDSGFSIEMPNNYVVGFDVDSKEVENKKLRATVKTLEEIDNTIKERKKGVFKVEKGSMPWFKTFLVNPLFNKMGRDAKRFSVNDKCTGCGICAKVCSVKNISVKEKPIWGRNCTQCMACINYCPIAAIQYGKGTEKRGRYTNPNV